MSDAELRRNLWDRAANTWRRLVDSATVAWDTSTPGQASASVPNLGIGTAQLANDSITYAKMQNVSASPRILGRKTASAGDPEECTLSEVLDFISSAAQGDILYRGSTSWARLPAGTLGEFLQTQGAGANPQWATPGGGLVKLNSGSVNNQATLPIVLTSYTAYRGLLILLDLVPATDNVSLLMRVSTDGGSSYDSGASDYRWSGTSWSSASVAAVGSTGDSSISLAGAIGNGSDEGVDVEVIILNQASAAKKTKIMSRVWTYQAADTAVGRISSAHRNAAQDTDAVQFFMSSGNLTGDWAIYGYA